MKTLGIVLMVAGLAEHRLALAAIGAAIWYFTPDAGASSGPPGQQPPLNDQNQFQPIHQPFSFVRPDASISTLGNSSFGGSST